MAMSECDSLKVDVPVGFLLPEAREILVSVDRASEAPLSIRLRLVPAEVDGVSSTAVRAKSQPHPKQIPVSKLKKSRVDWKCPGPSCGRLTVA